MYVVNTASNMSSKIAFSSFSLRFKLDNLQTNYVALRLAVIKSWVIKIMASTISLSLKGSVHYMYIIGFFFHKICLSGFGNNK